MNTVRPNTFYRRFLMTSISTRNSILQGVQVLHIKSSSTPEFPSPDIRAQIGVETIFQRRPLSLGFSLGNVQH